MHKLTFVTLYNDNQPDWLDDDYEQEEFEMNEEDDEDNFDALDIDDDES